MKKNKTALFLLLIGLVAGLTCGCGGDDTADYKVEGLEQLAAIHAISREEGSGTRTAFSQLIGISEDTTPTQDGATIAESTEDVIEGVEADASAIGYVSSGALADNSQVKSLSIDGVSLSEGSKKYPLSRPFILAYSGKLNALEQDFLTYVCGAGQEIVGKSYEAVNESSTFLSDKSKGTLTIVGSTSMASLMQELADEYQKLNPNATIQIEETDSTDGLTQAMSGDCDFGMSSRALKTYERELLDYEEIARDDIAVVVNTENPLSNMSLTKLKKIYSGDVVNWTDLQEE